MDTTIHKQKAKYIQSLNVFIIAGTEWYIQGQSISLQVLVRRKSDAIIC
jgi:hypothetical protein